MMYTLSQTDQHSFSRDVYVLDLIRTPATNALASISSDQRLSVLDPSHLGKGPVVSFNLAADGGHGSVTTLRLFGDDASVVCTAGEAGGVAVWDLRAGSKVVQFEGESSLREREEGC
jgi:WD40 repeat protein